MQIIVCFISVISKYALVDLGAEEVDLVVLEIDFVGLGIDFVDLLDVAPLGFGFVAVEIDLWEYLILK